MVNTFLALCPKLPLRHRTFESVLKVMAATWWMVALLLESFLFAAVAVLSVRHRTDS
jgi:hypothetical protein